MSNSTMWSPEGIESLLLETGRPTSVFMKDVVLEIIHWSKLHTPDYAQFMEIMRAPEAQALLAHLMDLPVSDVWQELFIIAQADNPLPASFAIPPSAVLDDKLGDVLEPTDTELSNVEDEVSALPDTTDPAITDLPVTGASNE